MQYSATTITSQVNSSYNRSRSSVNRNHHENNQFYSSKQPNNNQQPNLKQLHPISYMTKPVVHIEVNHHNQHHQNSSFSNYPPAVINSNDANNDQSNLQVPDSASLVKVRTWYTVAKQGVSF